jgi:hypothetical protein
MRRILAVLLATALNSGVALAQSKTEPDSWSATSGWDSNSATTPSTYDGPHFGAATRNAEGVLCVTVPALMGKPQYGVTTTCYPDANQIRAAEEARATADRGRQRAAALPNN